MCPTNKRLQTRHSNGTTEWLVRQKNMKDLYQTANTDTSHTGTVLSEEPLAKRQSDKLHTECTLAVCSSSSNTQLPVNTYHTRIVLSGGLRLLLTLTYHYSLTLMNQVDQLKVFPCRLLAVLSSPTRIVVENRVELITMDL